MKILILSTVHNWNDPRVFYKQACTLAKEYEVVLAAVDDGEERIVNGVKIRPLGVWKSRLDRPGLWLRAYREVFRTRSDAVHFHDPELALILLPYALLGNKRMVLDVHEHPLGGYGRRPWIPKILQRWIAAFIQRFYWSSPYIYDGVVLAEEGYKSAFPEKQNVHLIRNWAPIPEPDVPFVDRYEGFDPYRELRLIYMGCLMEYRGALTMPEMMRILRKRYPGVTLDLVGKAMPPSLVPLIQQASSELGGAIKLHGYMDWNQMEPIISRAHIGLIPLKPDPNHTVSLVTKFFDYMMFGLPCVASDFPLWVRFLQENPVGVNADATDPDRFAEAIVSLVESPDRLRELSRNGYRLVREKFRWAFEGERLLEMYRNLGR